MEEDDILGQYNLPHEVEKYYCQVDTLRVYNAQSKIGIFYAREEEEFNELDYTRQRRIQQFKDSMADFVFPGLKNVQNDDGHLLFLSNFVGGNLTYIFGPGMSKLLLMPRPGVGTEGHATDLAEVIIASLYQCESVVLGGELIEFIKKDADMQKKEKAFIDDMIKDKDFIRIGKYGKSFEVQFGGSRGNGDGSWTSAVVDATFNPLTWIIRNTYVIANAVKNGDGSVTITYSLDPNEKLDLRPGNREFWYNVATIITGFVYHDIYRGNDQMRVKATWSTTIRL